MTKTSVVIPEPAMNWLRAESAATGATVVALIRLAVEQLRERREKPSWETKVGAMPNTVDTQT